jgi:hypothetical protein
MINTLEEYYQSIDKIHGTDDITDEEILKISEEQDDFARRNPALFRKFKEDSMKSDANGMNLDKDGNVI